MTLDVVVTGAGGRTGSLVFQLLKADTAAFSVTGLARNMDAAAETLGSAESLLKADITEPKLLEEQLTGKRALVVLTSAVPRMEQREEGMPPSFYYDAGGLPEDIDWIGGRNQIDAAKRLGFSHVVFVGSMGSTDDNNMLNKIGNGNILKFKRKAEMYLIESGLSYTIINPSGLLNDTAGERELVAGKNDELFSIFEKHECGIPRGDVARVVVSALKTESAKNKVLDLIAKPIGQGVATGDVSHLFELASSTL